MPFIDLQSWLGINVDKWFLAQSDKQPHMWAARCHAFEKDWIECANGIGLTRAKKECTVELEDFHECLFHHKILKRLYDVRTQKKKMIKEGTYTPPPHQTDNEEARP